MQVGEAAYLKVKQQNEVGTFMDWGLEKDLLVPKSEQQTGMKVGRRYVVKVCLDEQTHRVYGTTRIARHSRVYSSSIGRNFSGRPSVVWSFTKS